MISFNLSDKKKLPIEKNCNKKVKTMRQESYTKKDGTTGHSYSLEAGDIVTPLFSKVRSTPNMNFPGKFNHSLKCNSAKYGEVFVKITEGQAKQLAKTPDLNGKVIVAYEYTAYNKPQVGVNVK